MNFILAFLVLFMFGIGNHGQEKNPEIFLYSGKSVTELNTITMAYLERKKFQFIIGSPYKLQSASVDSAEVGLCALRKSPLKRLNICGVSASLRRKVRWYTITWETALNVGSEQHTVYLISRSGKTYKKDFTINVEGNKRQERPRGEN